MLNFRKLKQSFASGIVKEGRELYEGEKVIAAKILHLDSKSIRISGRIVGQYENTYQSEIEIDRQECDAIDSDCDCPYNYDCQHLAALLFYLEENLDGILVAYSKETDLTQEDGVEKEQLLEKFKEAETKEVQRQEELYQKQLLQEYVTASHILAASPFFYSQKKREMDKAECLFIFNLPSQLNGDIEMQMALRLPFRSKPLHIPNIKHFLESVRYEEELFIGGKRYCFSLNSFEPERVELFSGLMEQIRFVENATSEKALRIGLIDHELFGMVLAKAYDLAMSQSQRRSFSSREEELPLLHGFFEGSLDVPLRFSATSAALRFSLEYIQPPTSKILLKPKIVSDEGCFELGEVRFLECVKPGMLCNNTYYRFTSNITRCHLRNLKQMYDMTIPEPLFGTFVENALPELVKYAEITNQQIIEHFVTLPFVGQVEAYCDLSYLDGELEASLYFCYEKCKLPAASAHLTNEHLSSFVLKEGILARNLVEEQRILEDLFQDFTYNPLNGTYVAKSDKKIVEFMTDIIPRNQPQVVFNCPQNLLDQFIYDQTTFKLNLRHIAKVNKYEVELIVEGALKGVKIDLLWECVASKKAFLELDVAKAKTKKSVESGGKISKILILDLEKINAIVQIFDELGVTILDDHREEKLLWSLAGVEASHFADLPIEFTITDQLINVREQMLGEKNLVCSPIPEEIQATLRTYQVEGVRWIEKLRFMYLNGILADDMGLGKTLQAIIAITQLHLQKGSSLSLIVSPTSLLYNWKEEFHKFNPKLKVMVIDGVPQNRKMLIENIADYTVIITSYTLLQKDIDSYKDISFSYAILDEAQHIKNRGTRNAKSVKMIQAEHRLILSGTPIENSLDELWSLFDFLMPGFLSTFERFSEKYIRTTGAEGVKNLQYLRKKVTPFIMRRMKSDVLEDLPAISEIVYHCQLSNVQLELYRSYAQSARDELVKLVERDGFDRVQIHVLATLTRLKQICCHPAIFAKETAEPGDSAKYDMLLELLQTLVAAKHKTVIFSQYTRMLQIMRHDLEQMGIRLAYLDGSSKNRLEIVKKFNEDSNLSVFLVSLKAGGTGLNLVGADTVIHYDMWWNPAVESQATDRVHRMGQKQSVSAYKLITLGSIEEKIAEMQKKKKGLVKKVVSCDDEAIAKLTWEDVLELLKT